MLWESLTWTERYSSPRVPFFFQSKLFSVWGLWTCCFVSEITDQPRKNSHHSILRLSAWDGRVRIAAAEATVSERGRPPSVDLVPAPQIRLPFDVFCTRRTWCMHSGKTLGPCRGSASGRSLTNAILPRFCPRFRKALPRVTLNTGQCTECSFSVLEKRSSSWQFPTTAVF